MPLRPIFVLLRTRDSITIIQKLKLIVFIDFRLNLELRNNEGHVSLWLALSHDDRVDPMDEDGLAAKLVKHGASPDAVNNVTGLWSADVATRVL